MTKQSPERVRRLASWGCVSFSKCAYRGGQSHKLKFITLPTDVSILGALLSTKHFFSHRHVQSCTSVTVVVISVKCLKAVKLLSGRALVDSKRARRPLTTSVRSLSYEFDVKLAAYLRVAASWGGGETSRMSRRAVAGLQLPVLLTVAHSSTFPSGVIRECIRGSAPLSCRHSHDRHQAVSHWTAKLLS